MRIASLIGNGLSLAYSDQLGTETLTEGIIGGFTALAGTDAGDALAHFAAQVTGRDDTGFESLLGPLDLITDALPVLGGATAPFRNVTWISNPLEDAAMALRRLHRLGLGTALGLIARRAHGEGEQALGRVREVTDALLTAADGDGLTIGTLNYDGLLQAALPNEDVADMAEGHREQRFQVAGEDLRSWPIRATTNMPDRDVHLIHMHGSLGWLRFPFDGVARKFEIDDLRRINLWEHLAANAIDVDPIVVLTDRKERVVASDPFALAYRVFSDRLVAADLWAIIGYGFGDTPVNNALKDAVRQRRELGLEDPATLVVGHGHPRQIRDEFRRALGRQPPTTVIVDGSGVPRAVGGQRWNEWLAR